MIKWCDLSTKETHYFIDAKNARNENRNLEIHIISEGLKQGSCPMLLRKIIEAQHSAEGVALGLPDGQSIKIKLLFATTIGFVTTVGARIIRIIAKSGLLLLSIPYSIAQDHRYRLKGELKEHMIRYIDEWSDLSATLLILPVGIINLLWIGIGTETIKNWGNYYLNRIDERNKRDYYVEQRIKEYVLNQKSVREAWKAKQHPPFLPNDDEGNEIPLNVKPLLIQEN